MWHYSINLLRLCITNVNRFSKKRHDNNPSLLVNTTPQTKSLLHSQKQGARGIGLKANNTELI